MNRQMMSLMALGLMGATALAPAAAQAQVRPTDYNYVGLGAGVGDIGDSDVGVAVTSKFSLGNQVSVRPGAVSDLDFSDGETLITLPVTYDFNPIGQNGRFLPYAGAGLAVTAGEEGDLGALLTAGVDYRMTERVTLNGGVNWAIDDDSQVNGVVSVGYTF